MNPQTHISLADSTNKKHGFDDPLAEGHVFALAALLLIWLFTLIYNTSLHRYKLWRLGQGNILVEIPEAVQTDTDGASPACAAERGEVPVEDGAAIATEGYSLGRVLRDPEREAYLMFERRLGLSAHSARDAFLMLTGATLITLAGYGPDVATLTLSFVCVGLTLFHVLILLCTAADYSLIFLHAIEITAWALIVVLVALAFRKE